MPTSLSPLALLGTIRDIMASDITGQARLDRVVQTIALGFGSEVCSVYLLRAGDILELFASVGLNPGSVHLTRLSVGEGLVGEIAATGESLNLAEASAHPKFAYRPETGEEIYHSFVGVPILQAGRAIGVLVVQGKEGRSYGHEQLEVLQTVAMVLSELAISNQFVSIEELQNSTSSPHASQEKSGVRLSSGIALAPAVMFESRRAITRLIGSDVEAERIRLEAAVERLQQSLKEMIGAAERSARLEEHDILEAHLLLTQDKGWRLRIDESITSGLTAEAAVRRVEEELRARLSQISSSYIRERMHDIEEISNRLISYLVGEEIVEAHLPARYILVARSIGPAELLGLDTKRLAGLVLEGGSASSHTAVIARALDIPAMAGVERATSIIRDGDLLILDANAGELYIRPSEDRLSAYTERKRQEQLRSAHYAKLTDLPAVTLDGVRVELRINAGLSVDAAALAINGVGGVGLYRTELPYMAASHFPNREVQGAFYRELLEQAKQARVVFRTLDIGSDKMVPYFSLPREENPAMGWRGARIGLDRPYMLKEQMAALLSAHAGRELSIMFPFIALTSELVTLKKRLLGIKHSMEGRGEPVPSHVRIGVMLEIPSLLWQLPQLLKEVDFIAFGSNDMLQFIFACDRGSELVGERYDVLSSPVLSIIKTVAEFCQQANVELGFCGDMARKSLEAITLLACGVRVLSMPASSVLPVKETIRSTHLADFSDYIQQLMLLDVPSLRSRIQAYAVDRGILF